MKATAQALLNLAAFVGLADDSEIDPDSSMRALEHLVHELNAGEPGEREYLKGLMRQEIGSMPEDRTTELQERVEFYMDFMESLDLNDADEGKAESIRIPADDITGA